jgi:hypothetical protein
MRSSRGCRPSPAPSGVRTGRLLSIYDLAAPVKGFHAAAGSRSLVVAPGGDGERRAKGSDPGAKILKVAWLPQGEMAVDEWVAAGRRFGAIARCSQWWIGDWIRYGTSHWGEKYSEAARITEYDIGSLRNMAWVASQFSLSLRSERLSWSHHALLAPLDDSEKAIWINRAIEDRLSVSDLRVELRSEQRERRLELGEVDSADQESESGLGEPKDGVVICPHCGGDVDLDGELEQPAPVRS